MKSTAWILTILALFFLPVGLVYGVLTNFEELVGFPAFIVASLTMLGLAMYLFKHDKAIGAQPQDNLAGEINDEHYEYGFYSPWSWWPLVVASGGAIVFTGVAVGWWIMPFGAVIAFVGLIGLVYEYDRGDHAH